MQRNISMDALRVVCAFLVVCIHTLPLSKSFTSLNDYTTVIWQALSRPGLPVFFILSGYFILGRRPADQPVLEVVTRALKIFIPFAVFFAIHFFSLAFAAGKGWEVVPRYFELLFYGAQREYGHLWFVYAILGIYILSPALNRLAYRLAFKEAVVVLVSLLLAKAYLVYMPAFFRAGIPLPLAAIPSLDTWLIYFFSGVAVSLAPLGYRKIALIVLLLALIVTALIIPLGQLYKPYDSGLNMYLACISVAYLAHATPVSDGEGCAQKFIRIVSRHSYGIYLIHIFVISVAANLFGVYSRMLNLWFFSAVFVAVTVFLLSLSVAITVDRLVCERLVKGASFIVSKFFRRGTC